MNELELSNSLADIEEEISFYSQRTQRSLWELGRRFKHVKKHDLTHGQFMDWYTNLGFNKNFVSDAINIAEEFPDFPTLGSFKSDTALRIASRIPREEREKEHTLESGETKTVDEMTVRELEEVKRKNREQEKRIKELENQKSEIVEKEVVKKVVPHDYEGLKSDIQQLELSNRQYRKKIESAEKRNEFIEAQYNELLEQRKEVNEKSKKYDELNEAIQDMQGKMDEGQKQIKAQKDVYELVRKTNDLIVEVAPLTYLIDAENVLKNEYAQKPIRKIITSLRDMADRLESSVEQDILEGEIINE